MTGPGSLAALLGSKPALAELQRALRLPHPVQHLELIETHIS